MRWNVRCEVEFVSDSRSWAATFSNGAKSIVILQPMGVQRLRQEKPPASGAMPACGLWISAILLMWAALIWDPRSLGKFKQVLSQEPKPHFVDPTDLGSNPSIAYLYPPETTKVSPVIQEDSSDARKTAAPAIS